MCIGLVPNDPWRRARKKPIIIVFREPIPQINFFLKAERISTKEGNLLAICGRDLVIKGVKGEIYPIDKKIFAETYEVLNGKTTLCCCCGLFLATESNGLCRDCAENCAGYLLKDQPCSTIESPKHRKRG